MRGSANVMHRDQTMQAIVDRGSTYELVERYAKEFYKDHATQHDQDTIALRKEAFNTKILLSSSPALAITGPGFGAPVQDPGKPVIDLSNDDDFSPDDVLVKHLDAFEYSQKQPVGKGVLVGPVCGQDGQLCGDCSELGEAGGCGERIKLRKRLRRQTTLSSLVTKNGEMVV